MKYMGSKSRIKKDILPIIQGIINENKITTYVEPFCGGCNIIDDIVCERRIANDKSKTLIELFKAIIQGKELPIEVPKELYDDVRSNKDTNKYEKWYIGAVGYLASYNGRYFDGGYAKTITSKTGNIRNYYDEAKRNLESQIDKLKTVEFYCGDYMELSIPIGSLIYCDIPYKGTKQYNTSKNFDYVQFWDWVKVKNKDNIIIVSEENASDFMTCIWKQNITRTQNNRSRHISEEKLFMYNPISGYVYD